MKVKTLQRVVVLVLAIALVFSFGGCKKSDETMLSDGTIVIKWYAMGTKQPDHDVVLEAFNQKLKEKYNMKLDLQLFNSADYGNKINLIMASNETFDLCFVSNWLNKLNVVASKGAILPLDDLIANNAPGLKDALPDYLFGMAKYGDKVYAVPNYQIEYSARGIMVQEDLAKKYNLDLDKINTITDLEPFLEQIKNNEPGIYPIQAEPKFYNTYEGITGTYTSIDTADENLKVFSEKTNDLVYKNLELCADWFKKGYIRQDIASVTSDVADVNANKYAVVLGTILPGVEGTMYAKTGKNYVCKALQEPFVSFQAGQSTMTAISSTSKHPDKAMKFLEIINTDKELFNLLMFGIEGTHYEKIADNQIRILDGGKYQLGISAWAFGNQLNTFYMENQKPGSWEETDRINREAATSPIIGFSPVIDNVKNELAAIETVVSEYNKLYTRDNWRELYKEQEEKLKVAGIDRVIAEIQSQLDAWKAANQ